MVYPNPAADETQLKFFSEKGGQYDLTIYNIVGDKVLHRELSAQAGINKSNIDVGILNAGIYTVELKLSSGVEYRQLII
jgi:ribosomal protein L9